MVVGAALTGLLLGGTASAFEGTPRPEWIGQSVTAAQLPHSGRPTVYIFAQPDCASCSLQLGAISSLQQGRPDLQVTVVTEQNSAALREYLSGFSLDSTVYPDTAGTTLKALALKTIPAVLYVNRTGTIEGFYEGSLSNAETKELGSALLSGKSLPRLTVPGSIGSPAATLPGVQWQDSRNHLLIFHSVGCRFCLDQLPHLIKYAAAHPDVSVWVIAGDDMAALEQQFAGKTPNIKFVQDPQDKALASRLFATYRVQGTPTQLLVGADGLIKWRDSGFDAATRNPFAPGKLPLNQP